MDMSNHKIGDLVYAMGELGVIRQISNTKKPYATYRVDWLKEGLNQYRHEWFMPHDIDRMKDNLNAIRTKT